MCLYGQNRSERISAIHMFYNDRGYRAAGGSHSDAWKSRMTAAEEYQRPTRAAIASIAGSGLSEGAEMNAGSCR